MIRVYIKHAVESNDKRFLPKHPHFSRSFETSDGESVQADSFDDTPYDVVVEVPFVSFSDMVRCGEKPQKMSAAGSVNGLTDAIVGQRFVEAFNAAGRRAPEPAPEPAPELASTAE